MHVDIQVKQLTKTRDVFTIVFSYSTDHISHPKSFPFHKNPDKGSKNLNPIFKLTLFPFLSDQSSWPTLAPLQGYYKDNTPIDHWAHMSRLP